LLRRCGRVGGKVISEITERASFIAFDSRLKLAPSPVPRLSGQQGHLPTRAPFEVLRWRWFEKFAMVCNLDMDKSSVVDGDPPRSPQRPRRRSPPPDLEHRQRRGSPAACNRRDPDAIARAPAARAVTLSVHLVDEVQRLRWFATDCNDLQTSPNQRRPLPARWDAPVGSATGYFQKPADADRSRQQLLHAGLVQPNRSTLYVRGGRRNARYTRPEIPG